MDRPARRPAIGSSRRRIATRSSGTRRRRCRRAGRGALSRSSIARRSEDTEDTKDTEATEADQTSVSSVSSVLNTQCRPRLLAQAFRLRATRPSECRLCREAVAIDTRLRGRAIWRWRARAAKRRTAAARATRSIAPRPSRRIGRRCTTKAASCGWRTTTCRARATRLRAPPTLMPSFSAAFSNLGATLGELGETGAGARRLRAGAGARSRQLHHPEQHRRRQPRAGTARSIRGGAAARHRAVAPAFVFGHYNLGHTLFLAGKYADALRAYEEGQRLDPRQEPAAGLPPRDRAAGQRRHRRRRAGSLAQRPSAAPPEEREDLLLEAYEIAHALQDHAARALRPTPRYGDFLASPRFAKSSNPSKLESMDTPDSAAPAGRGVGPSLVGQLIRDRSLRLAGGLAIAVAIPVAVLFYFQFRSIDDLGRSSAVVLRQLSQETADGVTRKIEDTLKAPYINVLLRTPQAQTDPLNLAAIEPTFEQGLGDDAVRQPVLRLVGRLDRAPRRAARLRPRERGLPRQRARSRRSSSAASASSRRRSARSASSRRPSTDGGAISRRSCGSCSRRATS